MRTLSVIVTTAAVALVVASGATPARSDAAERSGAAASTLSLVAVTGSQRGLNGFHFDRPPRAGDQIAETDALYTWAGRKRGHRVGRAEMIFIATTDMGRNGSVSLLTAQAFLPGGSLFVQGYARFGGSEQPATFPVLGGTGRYAAAHGYVTSRSLGQNRTNLQFHLLGDAAR